MEAPLLVSTRRADRPDNRWPIRQREETGVVSFHVGNDREATPLGWVILQQMAALGIAFQTEVADMAGISNSSVTRAIYGPGQLDPETVGKISTALRLDRNQMMTLAGHGATAESAAELIAAVRPNLDPLALEIAAILSPNSPVAEAKRDNFRIALDMIVDPLRKTMKVRRRSA